MRVRNIRKICVRSSTQHFWGPTTGQELSLALFTCLAFGRRVFIAALRFPSCGEQGLLFSCTGFHCGGFPSCRPGSRAWVSVAVVYGPGCSKLRGIPPGPGIKPVSPALSARLLTTGPQGSPGSALFNPFQKPWDR